MSPTHPNRKVVEEMTGDNLHDAKARLRNAARSIDPLSPLRKHPYTTVAVAGMTGFLIGSKDHPAIMKTVRLSMTVGNLLRPVLLSAGKLAATHFAKQAVGNAMAAAPEPGTDPVAVAGQAS